MYRSKFGKDYFTPSSLKKENFDSLEIKKEIENLAQVTGINCNYLDFSEVIKFATAKLRETRVREKKESLLRDMYKKTKQGIYAAIIRTGDLGSEPVVFDELDFAKDTEELLTKLGIFYITSVSQGHNRCFGLFELPVAGYDSYRSLIFPFVVTNMELKDKRTQGRDFCVLCIFYKEQYEPLFNNRESIRKKLNSIMRGITTLDKIDDSVLTSAKRLALDTI